MERVASVLRAARDMLLLVGYSKSNRDPTGEQFQLVMGSVAAIAGLMLLCVIAVVWSTPW